MAIYGNMVVPSKAAGGALPTDNSDRGVYVPGSEVSGRFSDAGVQIAGQAAQKSAEGLNNLARGIGQLAPMFVSIYDRQKRLDMTRAQEAVTRLQTDMIRKQTEWGRLKGADAVGANGQPDIMARYASWRDSTSAPKDLGEYGQRYYNMHADRIFAQAESWGQRYQDSQLDAYQQSTAKANMQSNIDLMAANPGNQQIEQQAFAQLDADVQRIGERAGWSQEAIEQEKKAARAKAVQAQIADRVAADDLPGVFSVLNRLGPYLSAGEFAQARLQVNQAWKVMYAKAAQDGDSAKMESLIKLAQTPIAQVRRKVPRANTAGLGGGDWNGMPVLNGWGVGALSNKHESEHQGSRHISFGLGTSDGIDVGKYSFITGGKDKKVARTGGSVGAFIRWARDKGAVGAKLYAETMNYIGGDWERLNYSEPWKSGGQMRRAWLEAADSGELEAMENRYTYEEMYLPAMRRLAARGGKGKATYDLIMSDQTGALQNVAFSTIMQHKQSLDHLEAAYSPDPATFLRNLGARRSETRWYVSSGYPNLGRKRQSRETPDALYMLTHPGPLAGGGQGAQSQTQTSGEKEKGESLITAETMEQAKNDYMPMAVTSQAWSEISKLPTQEARVDAARKVVEGIDNPVLAKTVRLNLNEKLRLSDEDFKAQSARTRQEWIQKLDGMDSVDAAQTLHIAVEAGSIKKEDAALVHKAMFGEPVDDANSRAALDRILEKIDNSEIQSKAQLETLCRASMLTTAQTKDAIKFLEMGGSAGSVKLDVWKRCYFEGIKNQTKKEYKNKPLPPGLIQVASSYLPVGKIPTEDEVQDAVDKACTKDRSLIGSKMLFEHIQGGKGEFSPEYTDEEYQQALADAAKEFKTNSPSMRMVDAMLRRNKGLELKKINRLGVK